MIQYRPDGAAIIFPSDEGCPKGGVGFSFIPLGGCPKGGVEFIPLR